MRRAVVAVLLGTSVGGVLVACEAPRREIVVRFKQPVDPQGPEAAAVREACPGGPKVVLQPPSRSDLPSEKYAPVRYDIRGASDAQYGPTLDCLGKQAAVYAAGISTGQ